MDATTPELDHLNAEIRQLRALYEQYFQGIERIEPLKKREEVNKLIRRLESIRRNNTAFKFRLNSAKATMLTYERYWNRISRQIEEGTFKRDRLKAKRRIDAKSDPAPKPTTPKPALNGKAPAPAEDDALRDLHRAYLRARTEVGDSRPVPISSFAKTVEKQKAAIRSKFNCEKVDFKVSVKNGRAILKAIPRT
ncbi:MAG: MXAN_5187 C-terminal domain-containing protein [Myxococcota bacterium]